jgi:hypothetical protein
MFSVAFWQQVNRLIYNEKAKLFRNIVAFCQQKLGNLPSKFWVMKRIYLILIEYFILASQLYMCARVDWPRRLNG